MKVGTGILLGVGGLMLWEYFNLGVTGATMQVLLNGVSINSLTDWVVQLLVQNVSNSSLQVNSLNGTISVNGQDIGNVSDFTGTVTVPPNSQVPVNVHVTPSLISIPGTVMDIIEGGAGNLNFKVTGYANVNTNVLPYSVEKVIAI